MVKYLKIDDCDDCLFCIHEELFCIHEECVRETFWYCKRNNIYSKKKHNLYRLCPLADDLIVNCVGEVKLIRNKKDDDIKN